MKTPFVAQNASSQNLFRPLWEEGDKFSLRVFLSSTQQPSNLSADDLIWSQDNLIYNTQVKSFVLERSLDVPVKAIRDISYAHIFLTNQRLSAQQPSFATIYANKKMTGLMDAEAEVGNLLSNEPLLKENAKTQLPYWYPFLDISLINDGGYLCINDVNPLVYTCNQTARI